MAPAKLPKKALKSIEKPVERPISKRTKKRKYSFDIYIYKLLKSIAPSSLRISRRSMAVMNHAVSDLLARLAAAAGRLAARAQRPTLRSRELQAAVRLELPAELAKHADMEGLKAVTMYHNSLAKKSTKK